MKFLQGGRALVSPLSLLLLLSFSPLPAVAANECQPSTWNNARRSVPTGVSPILKVRDGPPIGANSSSIAPGSVNCRFTSRTYDDVNYYTCTELAETFGIINELFFVLNPSLQKDCSNIQPNTKYCVAGCEFPRQRAEHTRGDLTLCSHRAATCH